MQALYFGESTRQLFGIYHEPEEYSSFSNRSVLICPPLADEYMATHWAMRRMASCIAEDGYHAFRFDYAGTGDSYGEFSEFSIQHWIDNIQAAATELMDLSGNRKVILLGLRFGAALAAVAARQLKIENIVLWEPVCDGQAYLSELQTKHAVKLANSRVGDISTDFPVRGGTEYLGFLYTASLLDDLSQLNILKEIEASTAPVSVVSSAADSKTKELIAALEGSGRLNKQYTFHEGDNWVNRIIAGEQVLITNDLVDTVKKALSLELS